MTKEDDIAASKSTEVGRRVAKLLESPNSSPELEREILWKLLESVKEISRSQRRVIISMAGIAAVFELLNRSLVGEISITGVKISDLDFLRALMPAAVAYCLFRFSVLARDLGVSNSIYDHLSCQRFHGLYESELDRVLATLHGPAAGRPPPAYTPRWRVVGDVAVLVQVFASVAGPLVFIAYAFWQVHARDGFDLLTWISFSASLVCVLLSVGFAMMAWNVDRWSFARQVDFNSHLMAAVRARKTTD